MDSSLKKRLKQSSRMETNSLSPITPKTTNKRNCLNDISETPKLNVSTNTGPVEYKKEEIETCDNKEKLWKMLNDLKRINAESDEKIRKLLLVRQHQNKNAPDKLINLIQKWLIAGQSSLQKLYEILPDPKPDDIGNLMIHLQINTELLKYNSENDTFNSN